MACGKMVENFCCDGEIVGMLPGFFGSGSDRGRELLVDYSFCPGLGRERTGVPKIYGEESRLAFLKGPVFDPAACCIYPFGDDVETEFLEESDNVWKFASPEAKGTTALVNRKPMLALRDVLDKIGAVLDAEDEGHDEIHGAREI